MQSFIMMSVLNVGMQTCDVLSAIILFVILQNVYHYDECRNTDSQYAECP